MILRTCNILFRTNTDLQREPLHRMIKITYHSMGDAFCMTYLNYLFSTYTDSERDALHMMFGVMPDILWRAAPDEVCQT